MASQSVRHFVITDLFLFPRWEQNIPTPGTKHSHAGNKTALRLVPDEVTARASRDYGSSSTRLRLVVSLLLLMVLGVSSAWGQTDSYEGTWYITNTSTTTNNYYLCPALGYYQNNFDTPYVTTYQTGKDKNSIWRIEKVDDGSDVYYRFIHNATGKYLTANDVVDSSNPARLRMHLEAFTTPTDATLFIIVKHTNKKLAIRSKDYDDSTNNHYWLDISGGNKGNYWNGNTEGSLGFWYNNPIDNNNAAPWTLETATGTCATPVITYNETENNFSISYPSDNTGVSILYTVDDTEPNSSSATYNNSPIDASEFAKLRTIAVKDGYASSAEAQVYGSSVYSGIHLLKTIDAANQSYYMIQPTDDSDNNAGRQYLTTSNVPNPRMQWQIKIANVDDGVQYYYIINDETGKYIYFTGTAMSQGSVFCVKSRDDDGTEANRFMFRIWEGDRYYNFSPKLFSGCFPSQNQNNMLRKQNATDHTNPIGLYQPNNDLARWQMVDVPADPKTLSALHADMVSDASNSVYFKLRNATQDDDGTDYFVYPPSSAAYATAAASGSNPEWYFVKATDADTWNTYYNIRNAQTGDYLYFDSETKYNNNDNNFLTSSGITSGSEDKYKFLILKTANTTYSGTYHIVPKAMRNNNNQANIALSRESKTSAKLRSSNSRNNSNACWYLDAVDFKCATPSFLYNSGKLTITCATEGSKIYYATEGNEPTISDECLYTGPVTIEGASPEVKAFAIRNNDGSDQSEIATFTLQVISSGDDITNMSGTYTLASNFTPSDTPIGTKDNPFQGTIDGQLNKFSISHPMFYYVENATIKNVILDNVTITSGITSDDDDNGNTGAIACVAKGTTRIYNCGVLATNSTVTTDDDGYTHITSNSSSVSGTGYVGGLVGLLDGTSRVINCFSYANVSGATVGGIVGYNNVTSNSTSIKTMVMNCMFYGDITAGNKVSPIYGGTTITNLQNNNGLNTFNFYAYTQLKTKKVTSDNEYKCALAVEDKYLNRFEFYRLLLNSNKKLAAFYATGTADNASLMAKWVLETADRTIENPCPYPILKAQDTYPSIINIDVEHAPDSASVGRNHGGVLGTKTLSVTISGVGDNAPIGASIKNGSLTLKRTDKDYDRFNFNYDKVQLPYYNDVGEGNCTDYRVVTGWKITNITTVSDDPYNSSNYDDTKTYASNPTYFEYPNYNFADRKSSQKDLYSVSKRVFSQGAYFDVPYGVTSITIEPYWAKCAYVSDPNYDVVYKNDYSTKTDVTATGTQVTVGTTLFHGQRIETTMANALDYIKNNLGGYGSTVYDNAVVLVGNLHLNGVPSGGTTPFTLMSVDDDCDNEPDYSLIYHHTGRTAISPIRFDFLPVIGTAQAQKPNGAGNVCNMTIVKTKDWFEITNTALLYYPQFEYENLEGNTKANSPLILLGGVFDQFVSTQKNNVDGNTIYIHVGSNVWFHEFGLGTHSDGDKSTPHVPVSVTGGDYDSFYLTGTYNQNAAVKDDNAECYVSSGRFGEMAGGAQEQIGNTNSANNGNVRWQIYNADITDFYGGGVNEAKPVQGNIRTDIFNSYVTTFCGGPKFGNMATGKTVTTNAEGCTFGKYFGAGFGGNSYSRKKYWDNASPNWTNLQKYYYNPGSSTNHENEKGKYYNGSSTNCPDSKYGKKGPGVAVDFDYEFFVWSTGATGGRIFVKFVSFSLAQCNNVNSTLTNCIINGNFYGGGSLGKVTGNATSLLRDCEVKGDVFGAGYSATLPPIPVRDSGFKAEGSTYLFPNYNKYAGIFEPGTFSETTDYSWTQVNSYPSEGGAGFDETQVITTQNLSHTNLGTVTGTVALTLDGTTVTGSVYGGGDQSTVSNPTTPTNAQTEVTIKGASQILGNVFGGGNQGLVSGSATVNIEE